MDFKTFTSAIAQIAEEKGISKEKVFETIEVALAAAYKKDYGKRGQIIKSKLTPKTGSVKFWQIKQVVDEKMVYSEEELEKLKEPSFAKAMEDKKNRLNEEGEDEESKIRFNPEKHIMVNEAKKIKAKIKPGEELEISLESNKDYGRIAAQTAKQVILQRIREAEREVILSEYKKKENEIVSGIVQRIEPRAVYFDIGKTIGVLPKEEQIPNEFYKQGQRLKLYIVRVEETPKGPMIFLSRAYPKIISKLIELEVPEVASGQVIIKSIAREAGSRVKIAVESNEKTIDPIGSVVGQRGNRIMAVISELGGEKIDIIEFSEKPEEYIGNSLSPAKVLDVKIEGRNKALVIVPEDQLSLAIGKNGQNVRLAAKLTGWKIDVRSPESEKKGKTETKKEKEKTKEKADKTKSKIQSSNDKSNPKPKIQKDK